MTIQTTLKRGLALLLLSVCLIACEKLIEIDLPNNQMNTQEVFADIYTINAARSNLYANFRDVPLFNGGSNGDLGRYTDELESFYQEDFFYTNTISASYSPVNQFWRTSYSNLYHINAYLEGLENYVMELFGTSKKFLSFTDMESLTKEVLIDKIMEKAEGRYKDKENDFGEERFREIERVVLLQVVDSKWMDHIDAMDQLRQGIGLRAYGQEDPVRAYQNEGFDMFNEMTKSIAEETVKFIYGVQNPDKVQRKRVAEPIVTNSDTISKTIVNKEKKIGRNDPCPCGSGKKYKKCCGK